MSTFYSAQARDSPPDIVLGSPCSSTPSPWSRSSSLTPLPDTPEPPDALERVGRLDPSLNGIEVEARRTGRVRKAKEIYDPSDEPVCNGTTKTSTNPPRIPGVTAKTKAGGTTNTSPANDILSSATKKKKERGNFGRGKASAIKHEKSEQSSSTESNQALPDNILSLTHKVAHASFTSAPKQAVTKRKRRTAVYHPTTFKASLLDSLISVFPEDAEGGPGQSEPRRSDHSQPPNQSSHCPVVKVEEESTAQVPVKRARKHRTALPVRELAPMREGFISSSTFAHVLRLVANLPPPSKQRNTRYQGPIPRPPVWAESRQELCEALPYYRAFQAGLYSNSRIAYGYLLEAFPAPRDIWALKGRLVISHGGGQCVRTTDGHGRLGQPALQADQSASDSRVDTLLNAYRNQTPIVLLVGEGYGSLPFPLGCAYAVLGWYWISYIWVEAEPTAIGVKPPTDRDYFHRYKVRFDWVESQGRPWWDTFELAEVPKSESTERPQSVQSKGIVQLVDPVSGLATPPVTPPKPIDVDLSNSLRIANASLGFATSSEIVASSADRRAAFDNISKLCPTCRKPSPHIYAEGWICCYYECPQFWLLQTSIGLLPIPPGFSLSYAPEWLSQVSWPGALTGVPYDVRPPAPASGLSEVGECPGDRTLWKGWACPNCHRANCRYRWEIWECVSCGKTHAPLDPAQIVAPPAQVDAAFLGDSVVDPLSDIQVDLGRTSGLSCTVVKYTLPRKTGRIYHIIPDDKKRADDIWELYQIQAAATPTPLFQRRALGCVSPKGQLLAQHFAVNSGASYKYNVDTLSLSFEDSPACVAKARDMITEHVTAIDLDGNFNEVLSVLYREGQKMSWHDDGEVGLGPIVASLSLGSAATMSWRPKGDRVEPNVGYFRGKEAKISRHTSDIALSFTLQHGDIIVQEGETIQTRYSHRVIPLGLRIAATARFIGE